MRIGPARREEIDGMPATVADVVWENADRPASSIYFATEDERDLAPPTGDAFLAAALIPALLEGERRIVVANGDPQVKHGADSVAAVMKAWDRVPLVADISIEEPVALERSPRAAQFVSGGVDGLTSLKVNHDSYPADHPARLDTAIMVEMYEGSDVPNHRARFDAIVENARPLLDDAEVRILPLHTNVRSLSDYDDWLVWMRKLFGSTLAGIAHALDFSVASIASTLSTGNLGPAGSHPLLDPYLSSTSLTVRHDGVYMTRLEKVRALAQWEGALDRIVVCTWPKDGLLNCGVCEKCVRTALEVIASGHESRAFPVEISAHRITSLRRLSSRSEGGDWRELVSPLEAVGRGDLADAVRAKVRAFDRDEFDRRRLKGAIGFTRQRTRPARQKVRSMMRRS